MPAKAVQFTGSWSVIPSGFTGFDVVLRSADGQSVLQSLQTDTSAKVTLPEGPEKSGYTFSGWAVTSGGEAKYTAGDQITLTGRLTLYAVYQAAKPPAPAYVIGYADGTFRPDETLTVGQAVRMLSRLGYGDVFTGEGMNAAAKVPRPVFLELLSTVTSADAKGTIAAGQTEKTANSGSPQVGSILTGDRAYITRAQAVTILNRVSGRAAIREDSPVVYSDLSTDYWAYGDIMAASAAS
jgi:uncharacterized repeat protein (TIGR02543 family)